MEFVAGVVAGWRPQPCVRRSGRDSGRLPATTVAPEQYVSVLAGKRDVLQAAPIVSAHSSEARLRRTAPICARRTSKERFPKRVGILPLQQRSSSILAI